MTQRADTLDPKARCIPATYFCDYRNCPTDKNGKPYKVGYRICKNFDCIQTLHITQSRFIAKKIYGKLPKLYQAFSVIPMPADELQKIAAPVDRDRPPRLCKVRGCDRPHAALNLCNPHHNQLYRVRAQGGKPKRIKRDNSDIAQYMIPPAGNDLKAKERYCHYPQCDRDYWARGLCKTHHKRWLRWEQENVRAS